MIRWRSALWIVNAIGQPSVEHNFIPFKSQKHFEIKKIINCLDLKLSSKKLMKIVEKICRISIVWAVIDSKTWNPPINGQLRCTWTRNAQRICLTVDQLVMTCGRHGTMKLRDGGNEEMRRREKEGGGGGLATVNSTRLIGRQKANRFFFVWTSCGFPE